jgi:hypothetical protein
MKYTPFVLFGAAVAALSVGNSQSLEWKSFNVSRSDERVTGISCTAKNSCIISTDASSYGNLYASNGTALGVVLLDGKEKELRFLGFEKVNGLTIAKNGFSRALISAKGDPTNKANWTYAVAAEKSVGGLNIQKGFGFKDGRYVMALTSYIAQSTDEFSAGAQFDAIWSPRDVPSNFMQLWRDSKQTLCRSRPAADTGRPFNLQNAYVAPDISLILFPSHWNDNEEKAAVCISTDGGKRFYRGELPGLQDRDHPLRMTCTSSNICFAMSNKASVSGVENDYIYYTTNAQQNPNSLWKAAKLPALKERSEFFTIFFAPDSKNGWVGGTVNKDSPLLFTTSDGGETWRDISQGVRTAAGSSQIHTGFALDANTIWLGTNKGTVITSAK